MELYIEYNGYVRKEDFPSFQRTVYYSDISTIELNEDKFVSDEEEHWTGIYVTPKYYDFRREINFKELKTLKIQENKLATDFELDMVAKVQNAWDKHKNKGKGALDSALK